MTELTTNAIGAARTAVEVRAWATRDGVSIEVIDDGPGFAPVIPLEARELDPLAEGGRGLFHRRRAGRRVHDRVGSERDDRSMLGCPMIRGKVAG